MNKHGFLMLDALVIVAIVSALSVLCVSVFSTNEKYEVAKREYREYTSERLVEIFNEVRECESCKIWND